MIRLLLFFLSILIVSLVFYFISRKPPVFKDILNLKISIDEKEKNYLKDFFHRNEINPEKISISLDHKEISSPFIRIENQNIVEIDFSSLSLKEMPDPAYFLKLSQINLSDNQIQNLSISQKNEFLTECILTGNQIEDLKGIENLPNLEGLFLNKNKIKSIHSLSSLKKLTRLDLSYNQIEELKNLSQVYELSFLNVSFNQIHEIIDLPQTGKLLTVFLNNNQIKDIQKLSLLKSLRYLNLENNNILDISPLLILKELHEIKLENNPIQKIGFELSKITKIEKEKIDPNHSPSDLKPAQINFKELPARNGSVFLKSQSFEKIQIGLSAKVICTGHIGSLNGIYEEKLEFLNSLSHNTLNVVINLSLKNGKIKIYLPSSEWNQGKFFESDGNKKIYVITDITKQGKDFFLLFEAINGKAEDISYTLTFYYS
ncbi:MAG TPA: hypothetical protein DHW82_09160 [Spirochaetia bacterium]|nr:hypothetical protein [Spirochaetia bacterium]